ncbi:hypothetical protein C8R45DRAFT_941814 [Mycena sanguinolenta]|nr:hypothetical protein C8R45DRAFT_941814 [Mycena sanguinolenta]
MGERSASGEGAAYNKPRKKPAKNTEGLRESSRPHAGEGERERARGKAESMRKDAMGASRKGSPTQPCGECWGSGTRCRWHRVPAVACVYAEGTRRSGSNGNESKGGVQRCSASRQKAEGGVRGAGCSARVPGSGEAAGCAGGGAIMSAVSAGCGAQCRRYYIDRRPNARAWVQPALKAGAGAAWVAGSSAGRDQIERGGRWDDASATSVTDARARAGGTKGGNGGWRMQTGLKDSCNRANEGPGNRTEVRGKPGQRYGQFQSNQALLASEKRHGGLSNSLLFNPKRPRSQLRTSKGAPQWADALGSERKGREQAWKRNDGCDGPSPVNPIWNERDAPVHGPSTGRRRTSGGRTRGVGRLSKLS